MTLSPGAGSAKVRPSGVTTVPEVAVQPLSSVCTDRVPGAQLAPAPGVAAWAGAAVMVRPARIATIAPVLSAFLTGRMVPFQRQATCPRS
ncbi:hypothetical protein WDV91_18500 [Curtobacterium flaccumfaciens pv. flaccumfaciens]